MLRVHMDMNAGCGSRAERSFPETRAAEYRLGYTRGMAAKLEFTS